MTEFPAGEGRLTPGQMAVRTAERQRWNMFDRVRDAEQRLSTTPDGRQWCCSCGGMNAWGRVYMTLRDERCHWCGAKRPELSGDESTPASYGRSE